MLSHFLRPLNYDSPLVKVHKKQWKPQLDGANFRLFVMFGIISEPLGECPSGWPMGGSAYEGQATPVGSSGWWFVAGWTQSNLV